MRSNLVSVISRYPVALAYLYGSAAVGRDTPLSDIDIALVLGEKQSIPVSRLAMELQVADELARVCGLKNADVRVIDNAPIMLRGEVVTLGVLIYSRDEVFRVEFETQTRSEYFDFLPIAMLHRQAFLEQLHQRGLNGSSLLGDR